MYIRLWKMSIRSGIFKCSRCNTYYNPTYGPCPTCFP